MRAATEGSLPPVMTQGNVFEVLGRGVRQGSPGELMVESSPSCQRRPPCKTNKEMSDEAADAAALTYLLTLMFYVKGKTVFSIVSFHLPLQSPLNPCTLAQRQTAVLNSFLKQRIVVGMQEKNKVLPGLRPCNAA